MRRILVTCGNGTAISTVVAARIREKCGDNGIPVSATQCKPLEVESKADDPDLLATTGKFTDGNMNIPVVGTISLLTGINEDTALDELLSYLKQGRVQVDSCWL